MSKLQAGITHPTPSSATDAEPIWIPLWPTPTPSEESGILTSDSFVGRQRKTGELRASVEDAMSGRGRLVMLVREPGVTG